MASSYYQKRFKELDDELTKKGTLEDKKGNQTTAVSSNSESSSYYASRFKELDDQINSNLKTNLSIDGVNKWFDDANSMLSEFSKSTDSEYKTYSKADTEKLNTFLVSSDDVWKYLVLHKGEFSNYSDLYKGYTQLTDALKSVIQANKFYSQFDTEDAYNKWYEKDSKIRELESPKDAKDFEEYSQIGAGVANPDWNDAQAPLDILGWKPFGDGEDIVNMVSFAEAYGDKALKASGQSMRGGSTASPYSELINLINQHMKPEEKAIYNYYVGKGDTEKANEYLEYITDILRQRQGGVIAEKGNNNLSELVMSYISGAQGGVQGFENFAKGIKGTEGTDISALQYASDEMRQDNTGVWKAANDLSTSIGNMTPSLVAGGFATMLAGPGAGKIVGSVATGISSAGNSYAEMIREGYGVDQARKYGIMVGTAEGGLSYLFSGIGSLGGKVTGNVVSKVVDGIDNGIARFFVDFAINSSSEALEEGAQAILDPIFKKIATGEDFEGIDWSEVAYSSLLGALSAGVLEAAPNAVGAINQNYQTSVANGGLSNMGAIKAFKDNGIKGVAEAYKQGKQNVTENAKAYVNEALEIDPDNAHAQRMQAKLDAGKDVSGYQINRLVEANESALVSQDKGKMKSATVERLTQLGEQGDVSRLADVLVKQASGETLSLSEKSVLKNSKFGQRVANELNPENIRSGEYSSSWAEKLDTDKINPNEYSRLIADLETETESTESPTETLSDVKTTPTTETTAEKGFEASTEGINRPVAKATMVDGEGNTVETNVAKIAEVENGEASLELEGGQTVKASEVDFKNSGIRVVYDSAVQMVSGVGGFNVDAANIMVRSVNPGISENAAYLYVAGFNEAYRYGAMGYPVSALATGKATSRLSETQRESAYNLGKAYGEGKVAEKQANIDSYKAEKTGQKAKKGKVYFDGSAVGKTLTERQRASLKGLRVVAEATGVNIHIFESKVGKNGKRQGANGWYDPSDNSIHLDLHAGVDGNGLMLFTASHELTHHIREVAPTKFKVFADALLDEYTKNGVSLDELISRKLETLEANGRLDGKTKEEAYDLAYEEVVADACESMLVDSDAIEALSRKIQAKDKGLWETIKDFIAKLVNRIRVAYKGIDPDSREGKLVREMQTSAERLQKLWVDALLEASEVSTEQTLGESGIIVNPKTDSASLMSVRDVLTDADRKKVSKALAERFGVTQAEAMDWLKAETSLASLILNPKYSQYLDYTGDPNEEAIKSNSDYPQGTVDFSNICKKRRDFTEVMNRVLRNFPNHVFAATDLAKIRTIMEQEGMEVACAICYVEDRRQLDSVVAQDFIDSLKIYREGGKVRPDGKPFNANQLKAFSLIEGDTYTPSIYELISLEGRNSLKAKNPAMEEAWVKFNNARGMQSVRLLLNDAEYKRQILKYSKSTVNRKNDLGGLRIYSFSDMEMFHLIDIIQVITDSATVGLSLQGYTKVNEYAKAVKDTGEKLNRSLIPKGDLGYHIENGRVVLDFDTVEGIDINHPDFFDNIDNPNVGNIVIGINATQIKAAMTSKFIDQIIPFHTGQSGEVLGEKGIAAWENYKDFQSERDASTKKKSSHQINIYTEVINAAEAEGHPITNKVEFVNKFLEVCKENNLIPRFSDFLNVDENGDYVYTEGYHKFLVDFKTFDQNTGEYLPQMPVKPIFDNEYITKLLTDYVKTQQTKDAEFTKAMPKVLDRITKEIVKNDGVKYSDRESNPYYGKVLYADSEVYDYSFLVSLDPMTVNTMPPLSAVKVDGRISQPKTIELGLKNAASIGVKVAEDQYAIKNAYTKRDIVLGKGGLQHSLDASNISRLRTNARLSAIGGYIVQNAVPINGLVKENKQANGTYAMACLLNDGDGFVVAIVTVDEFSSRATKFDFVEITHSINGRFLAKKEDSRSSTRELELGQKSLSTTAISEISIADFLEIVNSSHQSILSNDVLEHLGETRNPTGHYAKRVLFSDREQTSYAPTFYSHMGKVIDDVKLEKMGTSSILNHLKNRGVKDEEIKWSGIETFLEGKKSVTKAELQGFVAGSQLQIVEQISDDEDYTRWSDYKLDGGSNYREIVFQMPNSSYSNDAMKAHWGDEGEGVLAHARIQDMVTSDGKKMLFVEELQSDWHNEGHQTGYVDNQTEAEIDKLKSVADEKFLAVEDYSVAATGMAGEWETIKKTPRGAKLLREYREAQDSLNQAMNEAETKIPDAPFKNNYHEYVLKRLIRMAAEEGYDSIGWTPSEIQSDRWSDRYSEGYRIEYDQDIPKFLRKYGKKWGTTVDKADIKKEALGDRERILKENEIKNTKRDLEKAKKQLARTSRSYERAFIQSSIYSMEKTIATLEKELSESLSVWSMDITGSMKDSVLYEGQALYQDRNPDSYSNRSLLAGALETAAQNDIERDKLKQYKQKIDLINAEEQKLHNLREQIKELSFKKGPRDTQAIKSLQFEANQTANRINTYDRQLLNLESTKALKGVLEREKAQARKRAEKQGKEALERYRERAAKTQRELMDRYQESRKKATEGRNKTAMRHKIKDIVSELNTLLLRPTAKKHIKEELRKEVANALSAINMDTIGADERVAKYNYLIAKETNPDIIAELTKTRDNIQLQGEKLNDKLVALKDAYEKTKDTDDVELKLAYQEVIHNSIKNVTEKVGDTPIRNMTLEQLEMVYDLFKMIRHTIRDANKSFKEQKGLTIMQMAEAVNDQVRTVGGQPYKRNAVSAALQRVGWTFLKPFVAFRTIGSVTLTNMYKELRNGEDTFYRDVSEAQAFIEEQYKKHGFKSWDMKKTKTFTAKSGKSFDLTLEQMMTLYAYYHREKSHKHIIEGGIVFEDALVTEKNKLGIPIKYEVTTKDAFNLSEETFKGIAEYLETEHKEVAAFVNEMQEYLSTTMGAKGNEVSMQFLGVKLFKEKFYLPIKSSEYYMNFKPEEAGEIKLKSPAFSKETVPHANNPIVLHNFTDLWAEHINNMSMYHSFVLALEDFTRVYNYKTKTDDKVETMDTKATLETAYPGVTNYINKFLKDMNGGVRGETVGWAEKLTSLAKKGAVLGSWSVTIQQPSAVMRAMAMVNPKYFVTTAHKSINLVKHNQDWAELKKYAPIAGIKEMGRFDVGMGQGTVDWIKSNKTLKEKGEDILSAAPAYMDEVTWVTIWNAVKRETAHNNPTLKTSSDEFLKLAGERFTDVISLTQVYDSVFSRSDLMRNKSWIAKAVTAFMAEPTTTLNMIWDSWVTAKRTGGFKAYTKATVTTGGPIVASIVLNAALKSIIMAMRDDDEDESYAEKYLEHFFGDLKDNLNPLTLVPLAKDIISIFKGYDVERMDMAMFSDLKKAIDAFDSDSKTAYEKWSGLIGAISAFCGVPVKNVERDVRGLITTIFGKTEDTTEMGILNAIEEGWTGEGKSNGQQLYEAMVNGDAEQIERVKGRFEDQSAINTAIRKALRENDPRIKEAAEARYNGDIAGYMNIAKEIIREGHFKQDDIVAAINSEINALKPETQSTPSDKVVSLYSVGDYYTAIMGGQSSTAYAVREDLIATEIANGKDRDEAEDSFNNKLTNHIKEQFEVSEITEYEAEDMLTYAGKTEEEAASKVQYWSFKKQYPDYDLSESAVSKYYSEVESSGISVDVYYDYSKQRAKAKGEDLNGDGKTDSGSVKREVIQIIDSLPISSYQKDALYFLNGWSQSTLYEAPWH